MGKRIFVGNLSYDTDTTKLRDAFAAIGTIVDAKVVTDRETGRSRGFGFVEFTTTEHAAAAIAQLNSTALDGRTITVNEAKERERTGGGNSSGYRRESNSENSGDRHYRERRGRD